ncbi:conserved Plasmodium protein, unknown function, partial [Plasmodium relictum]
KELKENGSPAPLFEETPPKFLMKNRNEKKEPLSKNNTDGKEKCKIDFNVKSNFQISNVYSMNEKELKENGSPAPLFEETPPKFLMKNRNEKKEPLSKNNTDGKEKCKVDFNVGSSFQNSNTNSVNGEYMKRKHFLSPLYRENPSNFHIKIRKEEYNKVDMVDSSLNEKKNIDFSSNNNFQNIETDAESDIEFKKNTSFISEHKKSSTLISENEENKKEVIIHEDKLNMSNTNISTNDTEEEEKSEIGIIDADYVLNKNSDDYIRDLCAKLNQRNTLKKRKEDEEKIDLDTSDLESDTGHKKCIFVDFKDDSEHWIKKFPEFEPYTLPVTNEMPEDNMLNGFRSKLGKRLSHCEVSYYKECVDRLCKFEWDFVLEYFRYTRSVLYTLIYRYKKEVTVSEKSSKYYYYSKRIKELFPEYSFSTCKKIFAHFDKFKKNPLTEAAREEYIRDYCEMFNCEIEEIPQKLRFDLNHTAKVLHNVIEKIETINMKEELITYKTEFTRNNDYSVYYNDENPYIKYLKRVHDLFLEFIKKVRKYRYIAKYFDHDIDKITRSFSTQLCCCYRTIHFYLFKFKRICTDQRLSWKLLPELPFDKINSHEKVEKKVFIDDCTLNKVLLRYKNGLEKGTFMAHPPYDISHPDALFCINHFSSTLYLQICDALISRNVNISQLNNVITSIYANRYGLNVTDDMIRELKIEEKKYENYNPLEHSDQLINENYNNKENTKISEVSSINENNNNYGTQASHVSVQNTNNIETPLLLIKHSIDTTTTTVNEAIRNSTTLIKLDSSKTITLQKECTNNKHATVQEVDNKVCSTVIKPSYDCTMLKVIDNNYCQSKYHEDKKEKAKQEYEKKRKHEGEEKRKKLSCNKEEIGNSINGSKKRKVDALISNPIKEQEFGNKLLETSINKKKIYFTRNSGNKRKITNYDENIKNYKIQKCTDIKEKTVKENCDIQKIKEGYSKNNNSIKNKEIQKLTAEHIVREKSTKVNSHSRNAILIDKKKTHNYNLRKRTTIICSTNNNITNVNKNMKMNKRNINKLSTKKST